MAMRSAKTAKTVKTVKATGGFAPASASKVHHGGEFAKGGGRVTATALVDHESLSSRISADSSAKSPEIVYRHGPPESAADRQHMDRARAGGRVPVAITSAPIHHEIDDAGLRSYQSSRGYQDIPSHPGATHHFVEGEPKASAYPDPKRPGSWMVAEHGEKYAYGKDVAGKTTVRPEVGPDGKIAVGTDVARYKSEAAAKDRARRIAEKVAADASSTQRISAKDPRSIDVHEYTDPHHNRDYRVTFRVIHD